MICKTIKLSVKELESIEVAIRVFNIRNKTKCSRHWFMKKGIMDLVSAYVKQVEDR